MARAIESLRERGRLRKRIGSIQLSPHPLRRPMRPKRNRSGRSSKAYGGKGKVFAQRDRGSGGPRPGDFGVRLRLLLSAAPGVRACSHAIDVARRFPAQPAARSQYAGVDAVPEDHKLLHGRLKLDTAWGITRSHHRLGQISPGQRVNLPERVIPICAEGDS